MKTKSSTLAQHQSQNPQIKTPLNSENPTFILPYGPKLVVQKHFRDGFGRTKQEFKDECDINTLMSRYMKTGIHEFTNKHQGRYLDATGLEYQTMMNQVIDAQNLFMDLPSEIRNKFQNDPAKFLDFVHDDANEEEAHKLGLMAPGSIPPSKRAEIAAAADLAKRRAELEAQPKNKTAEGGTAKA